MKSKIKDIFKISKILNKNIWKYTFNVLILWIKGIEKYTEKYLDIKN